MNLLTLTSWNNPKVAVFHFGLPIHSLESADNVPSTRREARLAAGQFDKDLRLRRNVLQLASKIPIEFYFLSVVNVPEAFPSSRCKYIFVIVSSINSFNRRRSTPTGLSGLKATGFPTTKFPEAWIVNG